MRALGSEYLRSCSFFKYKTIETHARAFLPLNISAVDIGFNFELWRANSIYVWFQPHITYGTIWHWIHKIEVSMEYEIVDLKPPNIVYLQNTYLFFKKSVAPPYSLLMCWNTIWDSKVSKGGCCVQILCVEGGVKCHKTLWGCKMGSNPFWRSDI